MITLEEFSFKFNPILNIALQVNSLFSIGYFTEDEKEPNYIKRDYFLDTLNSVFKDTYTRLGIDWLSHILYNKVLGINTCYSVQLKQNVSSETTLDI